MDLATLVRSVFQDGDAASDQVLLMTAVMKSSNSFSASLRSSLFVTPFQPQR